MPLNTFETQVLKQVSTQIFEEASRGLGNMLSINMMLGDIDPVENGQFNDIPDLFEGEQPLLVTVKFKSGLSQPLQLLLKAQQAKLLADFMLGGNGVPNTLPITDMQLSAVTEAFTQMFQGAFFRKKSLFRTKVEVATVTTHHYDDLETEALLNHLHHGTIFSLHGQWNIVDQDSKDAIDFVGLVSETWVQQLASLYAVNDELLTQTKQTTDATNTGGVEIVGVKAPSTQEAIQEASSVLQPQMAMVQGQATATEAGLNHTPQAGYASHTGVMGGMASPQGGGFPPPPPPQYAQGGYTVQGVAYPPPVAGYTMPPPPASMGPNALHHGQNVTAQPVQFGNFDANAPAISGVEHQNLQLLMDIQLNLHVELGRSRLSIKEVLELTRGSVIELDRLAGEPVDLYANGKLIAKGEVVVIEDNFGLRVTTIIAPSERVKGL